MFGKIMNKLITTREESFVDLTTMLDTNIAEEDVKLETVENVETLKDEKIQETSKETFKETVKETLTEEKLREALKKDLDVYAINKYISPYNAPNFYFFEILKKMEEAVKLKNIEAERLEAERLEAVKLKNIEIINLQKLKNIEKLKTQNVLNVLFKQYFPIGISNWGKTSKINYTYSKTPGLSNYRYILNYSNNVTPLNSNGLNKAMKTKVKNDNIPRKRIYDVQDSLDFIKTGLICIGFANIAILVSIFRK